MVEWVVFPAFQTLVASHKMGEYQTLVVKSVIMLMPNPFQFGPKMCFVAVKKCNRQYQLTKTRLQRAFSKPPSKFLPVKESKVYFVGRSVGLKSHRSHILDRIITNRLPTRNHLAPPKKTSDVLSRVSMCTEEK